MFYSLTTLVFILQYHVPVSTGTHTRFFILWQLLCVYYTIIYTNVIRLHTHKKKILNIWVEFLTARFVLRKFLFALHKTRIICREDIRHELYAEKMYAMNYLQRRCTPWIFLYAIVALFMDSKHLSVGHINQIRFLLYLLTRRHLYIYSGNDFNQFLCF